MSADTHETPNVLFLLTDQQRYDAVGCYTDNPCETPSIDGIAASGTRFTRAYTPIALCSPARGSLLTGLYPHNHGLLANMGNFNGVFASQLEARVDRSYPRLLSEAGYDLGYAGKWHLPRDGAYWGFDEFHPQTEYFERVREQFDYDIAADDVQRLEFGGDAPFCGTATLPAEQMQEAWVADRTVEFLDTRADGDDPFAVCASFRGPHFPYAVPEPYDSMYDPDAVERPDNFDETFEGKPTIQQKEQLRWNASHLTWPDWQRVIAHYWGYCSYIDDQIGRILAALEDRGLVDDTVIVFTADHGSMLGNHRLFNKGMNMYEETHRIPLIVDGTGDTSEQTVDEFVSLVDLAPTLLDVAGAATPEDLDGRSLVPFLHGQEPEDWREAAFAEFHGYEPTLYSSRMIRTDAWKYVYNPASEDELYDLESDPGELTNLADDLGFKHVLRRMKGRLVEVMRETGDNLVGEGTWQSDQYDLYVSERER